jgi:hypothetical protein
MARRWISIRVELLGGRGEEFWPYPGRQPQIIDAANMVDSRLLETSRRAGVRPDSVQVSGGGLSTRLPTKYRCGSLSVCSPPGTVDEAWLERGLPSS